MMDHFTVHILYFVHVRGLVSSRRGSEPKEKSKMLIKTISFSIIGETLLVILIGILNIIFCYKIELLPVTLPSSMLTLLVPVTYVGSFVAIFYLFARWNKKRRALLAQGRQLSDSPAVFPVQ